MVPHSASAAHNEQRLAPYLAVKRNGAVRREEGNAKTCGVRQVNTIGQGDNIFLRQYDILSSRAERSLPLGIHHPHPLTNALRIDPVAYSIDHTGAITVRNDHWERQTTAATAQARLPVRWVDTRDAHAHPDVSWPGHWGIKFTKAQHISSHTELCVIGSTHVYSFHSGCQESPTSARPMYGYWANCSSDALCRLLVSLQLVQ